VVRIVKLVKNWRSHSAILEFSNLMFYNGELKPSSDPVLTHSMLNSDTLVTKGFPLIFHGITGRDEREASSPSFFNVGEASLVKKYCGDLIYGRKPSVRTCSDPGIAETLIIDFFLQVLRTLESSHLTMRNGVK
jgi:helicase MOV-10